MRDRKRRAILRVSTVLLLLVLTLQPVCALSFGDVNGDGATDSADLLTLARALAGWPGYAIPDPTVGDLNGDGAVNGKDRLRLARLLAGWPGYEAPGAQTAPAPLPTTAYYGYSTLAAESSAEAKLWYYNAFLAGLESRTDTIDLNASPYAGQISVEETARVFRIVAEDHPELFWVKGGFSYSHSGSHMVSLTPAYSCTAGELPALKASFDAAADAMLAGLTSGMSEYELEKALHDRIVNATSYDTAFANDWRYTAYGCLVDHTCVCEGYAKAFQTLLARVGIQSLYVSGDAGGGPHGWNIVRIGGSYYHADVTWDDPVSDVPVLRYKYFNVPDDYIAADHVTLSAQMACAPAACTSWTENYYVRGGLSATLDVDSLKLAIAAQAAGKSKTDSFEFFLPAALTMEDAQAFLTGGTPSNARLLATEIVAQCDPSYELDSFSYSFSADGRVFTFRLVLG